MHYCGRVLFRRTGERAASLRAPLRKIVQAAVWSTIFLVGLAACRGSDEGASDGTGGATSSASGGAAGSSRSGSWSCGTAAGVCTCVELGEEIQKRDQCPRSACCFESGPSRCSCRLEGAGLDCAELAESLGSTRRVDRCP